MKNDLARPREIGSPGRSYVAGYVYLALSIGRVLEEPRHPRDRSAKRSRSTRNVPRNGKLTIDEQGLPPE